jgi:hypothetical protein
MNWDTVLQYVLPFVLGVAAGLFSHWAYWGFQKRKQRLQRRRELVTRWRLELIPMVASSQQGHEIWAGPKQAKVLSSPFYASLRPHLSKEAIKKIEDPTMGLVLNRGGAPLSESHLAYRFPLKIFIDEIARIEREWNLV